MPRAGWVKPASDQRLSDHISIGVLTRVFPPELVDAVVADAGRVERRQRLLPARVVVYYVLAMALFSGSSYEEVMRLLVEGLSWVSGWQRSWEIPSKPAIFMARRRLGPEPLESLFAAVASPLALASIHALEGATWFALLNAMTVRFSGILRRPRVLKALDRTTGAVLISFGLHVATDSGR